MSRNHSVKDLSVEQLLALADIQKQRGTLMQKLRDLEIKASEIIGQKPGVVGDGNVSPLVSRRGDKKGAIVSLLVAAGRKGMTVKELASATGFDRQTVDRFVFSRALKSVTGFKRIAPARYVIITNSSGRDGRSVPRNKNRVVKVR